MFLSYGSLGPIFTSTKTRVEILVLDGSVQVRQVNPQQSGNKHLFIEQLHARRHAETGKGQNLLSYKVDL